MAHQKSFRLSPSKTAPSSRALQAVAQRVWTVLLSSVTCATVLGAPSILDSVKLGSANVHDIAMAQTTKPSTTTDASPAPAKSSNTLSMTKDGNSSDLTFAWSWFFALGLIGGLVAWWLLKDRGNSAASVPVDPIRSTVSVPTSSVPTSSVPTSVNPVVPAIDKPSLLDLNPRLSEQTSTTNPVGDDSIIVAVDHDVDSHGVATAQVSPRDSEGNSGGLKFQNTSAVVAPIVPALVFPHEPITQLPPDTYAPLDSTPPTATPIAIKPTIDQSSSQSSSQLSQIDPNGLLVASGIVAGIGAAALSKNTETLIADQLADVDQDLPDLATGYGESRIVLMPRDPQWAYTYWDIPDEYRQSVRYLGGQQLAFRLYDATDLDLDKNKPHSVQQYACDELAKDWYLPIPVSDRDYIAEIGYLTGVGEWLLLARSNRISIPPVYPTDWMDDRAITVDWEEPLQGKTVLQLISPGSVEPQANKVFHNQIFNIVYGVDQDSRIAGSLFGATYQVPPDSLSSFTLSSFVLPQGAGLWANEFPMGLTTPGIGMSGIGMSGIGMSGIGMSGVGMSGVGMSGVGMGVSMPTDRSRKFWLVADAELIVYGATEPDAQLTIGGVPVQLTPEGTFRIQLSFQDGNLDFPVMAIAKDGQQMRQIRMTFDRSTPLSKTNSKEDATDENY